MIQVSASFSSSCVKPYLLTDTKGNPFLGHILLYVKTSGVFDGRNFMDNFMYHQLSAAVQKRRIMQKHVTSCIIIM